jgi:hypothetical protein
MTNSLQQPFNPLQSLGDTTDEYAAMLLRNEVKEIIGSYHHTFDQLYECVQNAVDACERAFVEYQGDAQDAGYLPQVSIIVDLKSNQITVIDNGLGMPNDIVLKYFFTPHATLKATAEGNQQNVRQRGEKGVGATFLSYGANHIHVSTKAKDTGEITAGLLERGLDWCKECLPLLPMPQVVPHQVHEQIEGYDHGTAVTIRFSSETNIADLKDHAVTWKQWESILRLFTAAGYIDFEGNDSFLSVLQTSLTVINEEGQQETRFIEKGYLFPHLCTRANVRLGNLIRDDKGDIPQRHRDMDVLWEIITSDRVAAAVADRMANTPYLRHKKREQISSILHTHKLQAYVAFVSSAEFWEERNNEIWGPELEGQLRYGLVFFTKSQKLGEQKRIDFRFRSGDFNRFFILLDMQSLKADIGRKSLREEITDFGNFFANAIQRRFNDYSDCLRPSPGFFDEGQEATLEAIKDDAYAREAITIPALNLTRVPREEQDVVALFFNLLGRGVLKGFEIYSTHISRTYDGVGRFILNDASEHRYIPESNRLGIAQTKFTGGKTASANRLFIEFKFSTDGLVRDVRSGEKRLQDIKWLVCWEIGNRHINEGIGITDITDPVQINQRDYYGVTHIMTEGQSKVYVICLKKVLELIPKS